MQRALILLLVLALVASSTTCLLSVRAEARTITVPNDYPTLNDAIGNAMSGDTILVKRGTYTQQTLQINKSLSIQSEYTGEATIVLHPPQVPLDLFGQTLMTYVNPIEIRADNVKLSGFIVKSDGGSLSAIGDRIQIIDNEMDPWGIVIGGNGTKLSGNKIATVTLTGSNQTITDNYFSNLLVTGSYNLIQRNHGRGMTLNGSYNVINQNDYRITPGTDGGSVSGVLVSSGDHNVISNNNLIGQGTGIAVGYTGTGGSYNIFAGNTVEQAGLWGILMGKGDYNVFVANRIANNRGFGHDGYGIALGGSNIQLNNNLFYQNALINNSRNFGVNWDINGVNFFDNGKEGNYWDDYLTKYPNATEIDNSGTGDTPYNVWASNNLIDNYPLINQPETTKQIPVLPEPWQTLLSITTLTDPALTYVPSSNQQPTLTPSPLASQSPSPSSSLTQSPTINTGAEPPKTEPFSTTIIIGSLIAVMAVFGVGLLVYFKKRQKGKSS